MPGVVLRKNDNSYENTSGLMPSSDCIRLGSFSLYVTFQIFVGTVIVVPSRWLE